MLRRPLEYGLALRVGMMDEHPERWSTAHRRPLEHLEIAVGIAERRDGTAANLLIDADWLTGLVVVEVDLRKPEENRLAAPHLEPRFERRADYLLWRHPINSLGPRAHELDAATRHD